MIIGMQRNLKIYQAAIWVDGEPLNRSASAGFVGFRSSPVQVVKCSVEFLKFVELIRMAIDYEHMHKILVHITRVVVMTNMVRSISAKIRTVEAAGHRGFIERNRREWVRYW